MGVGTDGELDAGLDGHSAVDVLEVQSGGVGVDLQGRARPGGMLDHRGHVQVHRLPMAEEPAGRVADARDVRIVHRLERAGRDPLAGAAQRRVDRCDDPIQVGQQLVVEVELALREDVHLGPGQQGDPLESSR